MKKTTLGVIVGNRAFFPDKFVVEGRQEILNPTLAMKKAWPMPSGCQI
jgi:hypothetical protein